MSTNTVPQAVFGPGSLYVTRNDNAGPNTPVNIGYCNEFQFDETAEHKELYGQNQYPLVVARSVFKTSGKMKAAVISGLALNAAFYGLATSTGQLQAVFAESHPVPTTPFQVTIAPPGGGTFDTDLGVVNSVTGIPLVKVASGPVTGQYSVAGAVYTMAAADVGNVLLFSYAYTTAGAGMKITVTNQPIGTTPTFQLDYVSTLYGASFYVRMFVCISTKLVRTFKLTDFMMPEIDFAFFPNVSGNVYTMSLANAA